MSVFIQLLHEPCQIPDVHLKEQSGQPAAHSHVVMSPLNATDAHVRKVHQLIFSRFFLIPPLSNLYNISAVFWAYYQNALLKRSSV